MPPRKRGSRIGKYLSDNARAKGKRARETVQQRERRLEYHRIRAGMIQKQRARMEVELLHRLEIVLQSQIEEIEIDDSDEDESVGMRTFKGLRNPNCSP